MKNWYTILQVDPRADVDMIRAAGKVLSARYHPDKKETANAQKFRDVREALKVLCDPLARAAFDRQLWEARAPKPPAPNQPRRTSVRPTPSELFNPPDIFQTAAQKAVNQFYGAIQNGVTDFFDDIRQRLFEQGERAQRRRRAG